MGSSRWSRCKLWATGVETWRWEWSPEAQMMLGRLALWKGALLVSRTHAIVAVFGLGMAGRVVVEGAPYSRGLLVEAYVPASSLTCRLHVSVGDLKRLFSDDLEKLLVGRKGEMVQEFVKMLYFDYTLETEEADSALPAGVRLRQHHYSDREPWSCLEERREGDYDIHWELRDTTVINNSRSTSPTRSIDSCPSSFSTAAESTMADTVTADPTMSDPTMADTLVVHNTSMADSTAAVALDSTSAVNLESIEADSTKDHPYMAVILDSNMAAPPDSTKEDSAMPVTRDSAMDNSTKADSTKLNLAMVVASDSAMAVNKDSTMDDVTTDVTPSSIMVDPIIDAASEPLDVDLDSALVDSTNGDLAKAGSPMDAAVDSTTALALESTMADSAIAVLKEAEALSQNPEDTSERGFEAVELEGRRGVQVGESEAEVKEITKDTQHGVKEDVEPATGGVSQNFESAAVVAEAVDSNSENGHSSTCSSLRMPPDERAVWVIQRLRVSGNHNVVDVTAGDDEKGAGLAGGRVPIGVVAEGDACSSRPQAAPPASPKKTRARIVLGRALGRGGNRHRPAKGVGEGGGISGGGTKSGGRVRVNAFTVRVDEYKEELRQVEATKAAKLQAWLAIKTRFRGLTLGTVTRVSGRLLSLMVYELPEQPGNLRIIFTNAPTGDTFSVTVGVGVLAKTDFATLLTNTTPRNWTLGQRRRIFKRAIAERAFFIPVEEDDLDDENLSIEKTTTKEPTSVVAASADVSGGTGTDAVRTLIRRRPRCAIRCLGRDSTVAYAPNAQRPSLAFGGRAKNVHHLQQPRVRDHRSCTVLDHRSPTTRTTLPAQVPVWRAHWAGEGSANNLTDLPGSQLVVARAWKVGSEGRQREVKEGEDDAVAAVARAPSSAAPAALRGGAIEPDEAAAEAGVRALPRSRPKRECGRGRRLCGGVACVGGKPGYFTLLRGNWAGVEDEFVLDWHTPRGFRAPWLGQVEAHTTFTLALVAGDLARLTEGSRLLAQAENWGRQEDAPEMETPSTSTSPPGGGDERGCQEKKHAFLMIPATEDEAWQLVARKVLGKCYWKRTRAPVSVTRASLEGTPPPLSTGVGTSPLLPPPCGSVGLPETSALFQRCQEELIVSEVSPASPTVPALGGGRHGAKGSRATDLRMVLGTSIFGRVMKVSAVGTVYCNPVHLLVTVSQWHRALRVRCYDFLSGETREAKRPAPDEDAEIIMEFQKMTSEARDAQLQVALAELVVFDVVDCASAGHEASRSAPKDYASENEESAAAGVIDRPVTWGVKFEEEGVDSIAVDAGGGQAYEDQVDLQLAAAAAQVEKRREDAMRMQQAARDKAKQASEKRQKSAAARKKKMQARRPRSKIERGGNTPPSTGGQKKPKRGRRGGGGGGGDGSSGSSSGSGDGSSTND